MNKYLQVGCEAPPIRRNIKVFAKAWGRGKSQRNGKVQQMVQENELGQKESSLHKERVKEKSFIGEKERGLKYFILNI